MLEVVLWLAAIGAAEPTDVAVISVIAGRRDDLNVSIVASEIAAAANMRPGLRVLSIEELFSRDTGEGTDRLRECGADEECIARVLASWSVELGMLVVINAEVDPMVISLRLVDVQQGMVIDRESGAFDVAEGTPANALRLRAARLFERRGHPLGARLSIVTDPPGAELQIVGPRGRIAERAPATVWLEPGKHDIEASASGRKDAQQSVELGAGETRQILISLVEADPASWWPWVAISAAAVVAAVVTVAIVVAPNDSCVCLGRPAPGCDC